MRDPLASLVFDASSVIRALRSPLPAGHFLNSDIAARWVKQGLLVDYEISTPLELRSRRIPFVAYPHEWCDAQLHAAGKLTLDIQEDAVASGYDLKDASAWNVVFAGCKPVFCDLLSFVALESARWWAFGQFARHFIFPLLLAQRRGFRAHQCFLVWQDGVPAEQARDLLGRGILFTRHAPLFLGAKKPVDASPSDVAAPDRIRKFRKGLHDASRWMLPKVTGSGNSSWANYQTERVHYDPVGLSHKQAVVERWLVAIRPAWVADFGCNTGEFSMMAARHSQGGVVALDSDHDSIQQLYRAADGTAIYPLVARLDDLSGGRGWAGDEFPGLNQRFHGRFDVAMMLALIHHLAVGASIPLDAIALFLHGCTTRWAIVEMVGQKDPQLRLLCAQRRRDPAEFTEERQRAALLAAGFDVEAEVPLPDTCRTLLLLRRRN